MDSTTISRVVLLALAALIVSGCTAAKEERLTEYEVGVSPLIEKATAGGMYHVQFRQGSSGAWNHLAGSERIISRGDRIGFQTAGKQVVAIASDEEFVLDPLPSDASHCAWVVSVGPPSEPSRPLDEEKIRTGGGAVLDTAARYLPSILRSVAR